MKYLQGDVVKILNTSGGVVASYTYDAWGKVTSSGSIGQINPIRYRGYYYDTDTGFYYLQSRYYDPAIKRFISADGTDNLGANGDFTSLNLYAYCGNNPVMGYDPMGKWTISWGGNVSACCFIGVSCSWNLVIDSSGNVAFQVSKSNLFKKGGYGAGIMMGTPSISASNAFTWTEYDTYESLEGEGLSIGGSVGDIGIEAIIPTAGEFDIDGLSLSYGKGKPDMGELHVTGSVTETKWKFNIYEVADKFKNSWKSFWSRERD